MHDILLPLFNSYEAFLARDFDTCFNLGQVLLVNELELDVCLNFVNKLSYPVAVAKLLHLVNCLLHFLNVVPTSWIHFLEQLHVLNLFPLYVGNSICDLFLNRCYLTIGFLSICKLNSVRTFTFFDNLIQKG